MHVAVRYLAQLKQASGRPGEQLEVPSPCSIDELFSQLAQRRGPALRDLLLDAAGRRQPTILVFLGDRQVAPEESAQLREGDVVTLLSPMAGG
jgi:molybdopterin converting factor small subunit